MASQPPTDDKGEKIDATPTEAAMDELIGSVTALGFYVAALIRLGKKYEGWGNEDLRAAIDRCPPQIERANRALRRLKALTARLPD